MTARDHPLSSLSVLGGLYCSVVQNLVEVGCVVLNTCASFIMDTLPVLEIV